MKTTACIKLLALLLLLAACDRTSKLSFEGGAPGGVHTIADLKARCTANSVAVTEDITLEGVVTGNDFYGEFYKTLVVEDASGGISLLIDGTRLAFDYPVGAAVTIFCNGLTLGDYGGKIQLGTAPDGDYGVGRIPHEELGRYLRRNPDKDRRPRGRMYVRRHRPPADRHLRMFRRSTVYRSGAVVRHRSGDLGTADLRTDADRRPRPDIPGPDAGDMRIRNGTRTAGHGFRIWNYRLFQREIHAPRLGAARRIR